MCLSKPMTITDGPEELDHARHAVQHALVHVQIDRRHRLGRLVVFAEGLGQAGGCVALVDLVFVVFVGLLKPAQQASKQTNKQT